MMMWLWTWPVVYIITEVILGLKAINYFALLEHNN